MEFFVGRVVHQDEHDVVGADEPVRLPRSMPSDAPLHGLARAEPEQVIVAGILPAFTQRHGPQLQPAKRRKHRSKGGPEEFMLPDGLEVHNSLEPLSGPRCSLSPRSLTTLPIESVATTGQARVSNRFGAAGPSGSTEFHAKPLQDCFRRSVSP